MKMHSSCLLLWEAWWTEGSNFWGPLLGPSLCLHWAHTSYGLLPACDWAYTAYSCKTWDSFKGRLWLEYSPSTWQKLSQTCTEFEILLPSAPLFSGLQQDQTCFVVWRLASPLSLTGVPPVNLLQRSLISCWHLLFRGPELKQFSKLSSFPFSLPLP